LNLLHLLIQTTHARIMTSSLHLSEGIFAPTPHPTPALRPSAPFLLAQCPHIGILASLLHPRPKPLHALTSVFRSALLPALSPNKTIFVFSLCGDGVPGGFGAGHPGNFHGPIALVEDVLVLVMAPAVVLFLLLLLLSS
jgi:hypothetical protein